VPAAAAPAAVAVKPAAALKFAARCTLAKNPKAVSCIVSSNTTAKFSGKVRLAGSKRSWATRSGTRKLHLRLHSAKRLKKGQKVVLALHCGRTSKLLTAKLK
jgi:hypothetical protein